MALTALLFAMATTATAATCYNELGSKVGCPDQAAIAAKKEMAATYQDNEDGSVLDFRTGLLWQKAGKPTPATWQESGAYCESLELAGANDWRMPSQEELLTIVEYGRSMNDINVVFNASPGAYWTTTPAAEGMCLTVGFLINANTAENADESHFIRCVK